MADEKRLRHGYLVEQVDGVQCFIEQEQACADSFTFGFVPPDRVRQEVQISTILGRMQVIEFSLRPRLHRIDTALEPEQGFVNMAQQTRQA